ncbi:MAG: DarT ssDNA thymidine ADP-ribosyltransferase family protein [Bryobacteraceae bacterium]
MDPLLRIPHLYHFTDVVNMPKIRELEGLFSTARLREMEQEFCAGGDQDSLGLDARWGMDQYVHLCWAQGHPMAGKIAQRKPDARLFYLKIDRAVLYAPGVKFATGVVYATGTEIVDLAEAVERNLIDFHALYNWTDWRDPQAQAARRAAELCEILVPDYIPLSYIRNLPNG